MSPKKILINFVHLKSAISFILVGISSLFLSSETHAAACTGNASPSSNCDSLVLNQPNLNITVPSTVTISGAPTGGLIWNREGAVGTTLTNNGTVSSTTSLVNGLYNGWDGPGSRPSNDGRITLFSNTGTVSVPGYAVLTRSTIDSLNNSGSLTSTGSTAVDVYQGGLITSLVNSGSITGSSYSFSIDSTSSIGTIDNRSGGTISGEFFNNGGSITTFRNAGTITTGTDNSDAFQNAGTINSFVNTGTISAGVTGVTLRTGSVITSFENSGNIYGGARSSSTGSGFFIQGGQITNLVNSGNIYSLRADGIYLDATASIGAITNTGSIYSSAGGIYKGISNGVGGTITTLNNAQGGNSSGSTTTALVYWGRLPVNYNIIVYSSTHYGQLDASSVSGTTTFGIYSGSTLTRGTYLSVLSGVSAGDIAGSTSGNYNGFTWRLNNSSGSIWDLIVTGASTTDTQQSLVNTASVLQGAYTLQNSVMVNGFTYDCPLFDKHGICVSAGGRNTTVQAQGINNTSGLLIASYRLDKNNSRIGAWVDQNLSVSSPSAVKLGNSTPMIGLFGVWSQRPDGVGAEVRVSAAYGQKDTTITRQIVGTSEAGSGSSQLISQGAQVVAKYGFAVMPDVVVSPYAGVRYTQNNMGGYTEATSSTVTTPLTYSALNTNATTALAGAEARYRGIPKTTLFASAGVETDTNTSNGSYSAIGVSGLTPVNFNPNPVTTRPTATAGAYYDIFKNQRIGVTGIYRQEPFQAVSTTTVLATYTIGL